MQHTFELSSAKYYAPIQAKLAKEERHLRNRQAIQDFGLGLLTIAAAVLLVQSVPDWLPIVRWVMLG